MKRRFRFQYEGNTYSVVVEKKGNEITVEKEGVTYSVTLLPEEEAAGAERAAGIRPESSVSCGGSCLIDRPADLSAGGAK